MKFIHLRHKKLLKAKKISEDPPEYEMKLGWAQHGGVTLAYDIQVIEASAIISIGAAYCSPDEMFHRALGSAIARDRIRSQPLQFRMDLEKKEDGSLDVPRNTTIASMFHAFLLLFRKVEWKHIPEPLHLRFKGRWLTEFLGPGGRVVSAAIDTRIHKDESRLIRLAPDLPVEHNPLGWLDSNPGWLLTFLEKAQ